MKKLISLTILTVAATAGAQTFNNLELGLTGGYAGGLSGEVFVHAPNVVGPVGVKVGVAYTRPSDAINDAADDGLGPFSDAKKPISQGGLGATEAGRHTVISVDGTYGLGEVAPGIDTMVYGGVRYGMFSSTEDYGASAGTRTYSSNSFGLGAGAMASYALTGNLSLVGDLGADYFFKNTINLVRNPPGSAQTTESVPTSDGSYSTYDNRFVRPGTSFKARIGVKYMF
ncbi:hypothetical protein ACFP9V_13900 [Deinococcus radiopugnans]|uniref:Porin family protein n=1 Tax=Deinococcus radiopugnans ATCC 19172 TaxID=585398 RepID=A0A5C4Y9Q1_9DEIO|nr:hypothetical protein [Deinococcus radiopugnans]MBB6016237.1 hypothetical protein [Deinococcus radiopugnans ATCC 19172]TNM72250.1 hypothetical protein FHR04_05360 [Deinococcus radiopugnans ATCC 19172]